jgi:hypothetical protein
MIMEPDIVYIAIFASVNTKLVVKMGSCDCDVTFMTKTITHKVVSLHLLIKLIIGSDDVDFLSQSCQLLR